MAAALPYAIGGILGGSILKKAFKKSTPTPAPDTGPTVMPLADDERIQAARRRSVAAQFARRGRESTILTGGDKLGG